MLRPLLGLVLVVTSLSHDVFHVNHADGRYKFRNREEATERCSQHNGRLATFEEVVAAHSEGYDKCECGWVTEHVALPVGKPRPGCGTLNEVRKCPENPRGWGNSGWDAFCVKEREVTCDTKVAFGPDAAEYADKPDDQANLFLDFTFEYDGVLSGWEYFSLRNDIVVYAAVYRPLGDNKFQTIGRTRLYTGRTGKVTYILKDEEKFEVKKGDIIGIHYDTIIFLKSRDYTVIPYATGDKNCDEQGNCVAEADQYDTWVFHRHEQQLFFRPGYVLKMDRVYDDDKKKVKRAPALKPIYCAVGVTFTTTTESTTAETTTTTTTEMTTPEPTPEPTTEPPPTPSTTTTTTPEPTTTTTPEPTTTTEAPTTEPPTTVNFDVTDQGFMAADAQPDQVPCSYPFTYRGSEVYGCTEVMSEGKPWCSTESVYTGKHWRFCNEADKTVDDFPCVFPFNYAGNSYSECTMEQSHTPWCSVSAEYSSHAWKYCNREELKVEELPCSYPWKYQEEEKQMCIKSGSNNYWCSVTEEYHSWSWRNCRSGDRIPSEMPCKYPFTYKDKQYNTCIFDSGSRAWCAVEEQYRGDNWRYCRDGDVFPEVEPCVLPFEYNGQEVEACTFAGSERPWCALSKVYDPNNWRYCREVTIHSNSAEVAATVEEARLMCKNYGFDQASMQDLKAAVEMGQHHCWCSWLSDGTVVKIVKEPGPPGSECGTEKGIVQCEKKEGEKYAAMCSIIE